jgi:hypothetical protein
MNTSEAARFREAVALRVRGASLVPPAPVVARTEEPQRRFTDCPSAHAVSDMLPNAQRCALSDEVTTLVRQLLDPLIVAEARTSVEELMLRLSPLNAEGLKNVMPNVIALYIEKAYAQTVHITLDAPRTDGVRIVSYKLYARMQEILKPS